MTSMPLLNELYKIRIVQLELELALAIHPLITEHIIKDGSQRYCYRVTFPNYVSQSISPYPYDSIVDILRVYILGS